MHTTHCHHSDNNSPASRPDSTEPSGSLLPWLVLAHIPHMHSRLFNRLLEVYQSPEKILACNAKTLEAAGVEAGMARTMHDAGRGKLPDTLKAAVDACMIWLDGEQHFILHSQSPEYPALLATIPDPPPLLYVSGNPDYLQSAMIAMVGSRRPSADGRRNARRFAGELVMSGLGVCSGLALGIDVESHAGALQEDGNTVAVLGTGIDIVYPARNRSMFDSIAGNGALVSEFNLGVPPLPGHFPRRNRIISGLSLGVLVVEAGLRSGSMITARFALEQGREVFAIPGSIHNPMTKGCHHLISQGAKLVQQVADIVEECAGPFIAAASEAQPVSAQLAQLPAELATIMAAIGHDPVTLDELLCETGLEIDHVSTVLVELELRGLVIRDVSGFVLNTG